MNSLIFSFGDLVLTGSSRSLDFDFERDRLDERRLVEEFDRFLARRTPFEDDWATFCTLTSLPLK